MSPESEQFFAGWGELRLRYATAAGAEKDVIAEQLGAMQDHFDSTCR